MGGPAAATAQSCLAALLGAAAVTLLALELRGRRLQRARPPLTARLFARCALFVAACVLVVSLGRGDEQPRIAPALLLLALGLGGNALMAFLLSYTAMLHALSRAAARLKAHDVWLRVHARPLVLTAAILLACSVALSVAVAVVAAVSGELRAVASVEAAAAVLQFVALGFYIFHSWRDAALIKKAVDQPPPNALQPGTRDVLIHVLRKVRLLQAITFALLVLQLIPQSLFLARFGDSREPWTPRGVGFRLDARLWTQLAACLIFLPQSAKQLVRFARGDGKVAPSAASIGAASSSPRSSHPSWPSHVRARSSTALEAAITALPLSAWLPRAAADADASSRPLTPLPVIPEP